MIKPTTYPCHVCGKRFTKEQEVYAVANLMVVAARADNRLHWRYIKNDDPVHPVSLFFHRGCFASMAGEGFLGREK